MVTRYYLVFLFLSFSLYAFAQPSITSFSPTSGIVGQTVTITGTNFSTTAANNTVRFNGVIATISGIPTATTIIAIVPSGATTGTISVTVATATATSNTNFTIPPPTITNFNPVRSLTGTAVTISGTNFSITSSNNIVRFNNVIATISGTPTSTSITAIVPSTATSGPISVSVGGQTTTTTNNYIVCRPITIAVTTTNKTNFTFEASGGTAPYTYSTDGVNFAPSTSFNLNAGVYTVTAKDANGCTGTTDFRINGIVDCGVTQAAGGQGTSFTTHILGSGSGQVRIEYEMFPNPDQMDVYYDNQLVATTSTLVSNQGILSFNYTYDPTKPNFCVIKIYAPNNGTEWNYAAYCPEIPKPRIRSFSPGFGPTGTSVVINGFNLGGSTVKFGNAIVTSPVINTQGTSITASVPANAITAPIVISNNFGTSFSEQNFTVSPYCQSYATNDVATRIDRVIFAGIDKPSPAGVCETYTDNTNMIGFVVVGQTYDLKVTLGSCGLNYNKLVKAFIDWNGDNDFADINETVATTATVNSTTREETFSVTVPAGINPITTRMRVVLRETSNPTSVSACGTYTWGETEDYSIRILPSASTVVSASPTQLTEFQSSTNFASAPSSFTLSGTNLSTNNLTVTAPTHFQISTQATTGFTNSIVIIPTAGNVSTPIYVRYLPTVTGNHSGSITVTNSTIGINATVALSGRSASPSPQLAAYGILNQFTSTGVGQVSSEQTIRISGSFLSGSVSIVAPLNFQISLSTTFTNSLTLTPINGVIQDQIVKVRFNPTVSGISTGNIAISSSGINTQNLPVSGTVSGSGTNLSITSFSPTSGPIGTNVTITGTSFSTIAANNIVKFNGVNASIVGTPTTTSIVASVPLGASTGAISITIGSATATSTNSFQVTSTTAPTISGFTPSSGSVGTNVSLTGTNFSLIAANNIVKFNGVTASIVGNPTSTSIVATVPSGATSGPISVTIGNETVTSSSPFSVISLTAPTITGLNPTIGSPGTTVIITGANFSTAPTNNIVRFNNTLATVNSSSSTSITTTVPVGATSGFITVTVGSETVSSTLIFTVTGSGSLKIIGLNPTSGPVGTSVEITGTSFDNVHLNNVVKFNGVQAITSSSTGTIITAVVPTGATTGLITVEVGSDKATSPFGFSVSPTISSFSPTSGLPLSSVVISGLNFSALNSENQVFFNNKQATIVSSTLTSITALVPADATTGKVRVTTLGFSGTSTNDFVIIPCTKPDKPTITASNLNTETPILTSSASTGNQWFLNNNVIPNATNSTLNVQTPGIYKVQVSQSGCISDFSDNYAIIVTGDINSNTTVNYIHFYPNPASSSVSFQVDLEGEKKISLYHVNGTLVKELKSSNRNIEVNVEDLNTGLYIFKVNSNNILFTGKLFVK